MKKYMFQFEKDIIFSFYVIKYILNEKHCIHS